MKKFEYVQPEFLMCCIAVEDGTQNDDRVWIYHRLSLSLIEFICVDDFKDFQFSEKQDRFEYQEENWFGVFVQNNCEATDNNADVVMKAAWNYLRDYFISNDDNMKSITFPKN